MRSKIEILLQLIYSVELVINLGLAKLYGDGLEVERRLISQSRRRAARDARYCIRKIAAAQKPLELLAAVDPIPFLHYSDLPHRGKPGRACILTLERTAKWSAVLAVPFLGCLGWTDSPVKLGPAWTVLAMFIPPALIIGPLMLSDILMLLNGWSGGRDKI